MYHNKRLWYTKQQTLESEASMIYDLVINETNHVERPFRVDMGDDEAEYIECLHNSSKSVWGQ